MTLIQIKRGLAASWVSANPILALGEFGLETDTGKIKLGTGLAHWLDLNYMPQSAADLGVDNVDNTADADKPISTATQNALDDKSDVGHSHVTSDVSGLDTTISGLNSAVGGKEPAITAGTTSQYWRGDKSFQTLNKAAVGLENVDNTSDATKDSATATLTNKTISGADNTLSAIPQSAVTDLTADLSAKEIAANKGVANGYAGLDGGGKVPVSQLPNSIMEYQGLWNAAANSPSLADGTGDPGSVYRVSTAGSQNLGSGTVAFAVGDYVIYSPATSAWEKADTTDSVVSINGYTGNVSLDTGAIVEGSNLYYTDSRADARISAAVGVSVQGYDSDLEAFAAKTAPTGDVVGTSDTQTLTSKTLTNPTITNYTETFNNIGTVGAANTIALTSGTVQHATLTASTATTFTMPTVGAGKSFTLMLKQPASTGGGTATFTGVKWATSGAPTITPAAGRMDILSFFSDGTNWYGSAAQGYTY